MFTKVYWFFWAVLGLITLGLFITGGLTFFAASVIGFMSCLMIFVGMMCVTISIVGPHATEFQHADAEPLPRAKPQRAPRLPATAMVQSRIAQ
jgi:hypothetical protein